MYRNTNDDNDNRNTNLDDDFLVKICHFSDNLLLGEKKICLDISVKKGSLLLNLLKLQYTQCNTFISISDGDTSDFGKPHQPL